MCDLKYRCKLMVCHSFIFDHHLVDCVDFGNSYYHNQMLSKGTGKSLHLVRRFPKKG